MKWKRIIWIALIIVVALAAGLFLWLNRKDDTSGTKQPQIISGKVDSISNGCQADGGCSVTLDNGKTIITGCGLMANGKTCKTYDQTKLKHGQQIEATVIQVDEKTYGLDCNTCTIRPQD